MNHEARVRCWRCADEHWPTLFCPACGVLQSLSPQLDYFSLLGLPRSPVVDESALTQRYYDLSRRLHPDLYQTGTAEEKAASMKNTALLNRAYRTLRDLVQRSQYWLELQGEQLGKDNNRVPPALAALVFEVQEKLAEIHELRAENRKPEQHSELAQIRLELNNKMAGLRTALMNNLTRWDGETGSAELLRELKNLLSEIAYLRTLQRDVEKESEAVWNV
jgi:molecular chaperone HscB